MMMLNYKGGRRVKNLEKGDYVISEPSLFNMSDHIHENIIFLSINICFMFSLQQFLILILTVIQVKTGLIKPL